LDRDLRPSRHAEAGIAQLEAALRKTMSDRGVDQLLAEVGTEPGRTSSMS
jgi:hypothetical protein